ncbi:MAG: hypothetical protein C4576_35840 [Desulfobacteraceae bacterium]|nr:MAG: hypothetical protein C4576_35840 [Desulfobacteraceae bacterium]
MGHILEFHPKHKDGLITGSPLEFRRASWESAHFLQMLKSQSEKLEQHRKEVQEKGGEGVWHLPPHYVLRGGLACTIAGLYRHRENEEKMRDVYYLAGLVDCMVNQVNPVLRTGLIHGLYQKVMTLRTILGINWYGPIDQVLFPLDTQFYNEMEYRQVLTDTKEMSLLYQIIREGTDEMFDILSLEYCFYAPGRFSL